ncbi:MAG: hypothetical protein RIB84_23480 [Sneathiellaceae bacterium]
MAKQQHRYRSGAAARAAALAASLAVLPAAALVAAPAAAQDEPKAQGELDAAGKLALEAANKAVRALELFFDDLPKYEAPEVLPNGDIIMRRLDTPDGTAPAPEAETDRADEQQIPPGLPRSNRSPDGGGGERRI